jgi:uncharacterized protein (DUF2249 family)/iron-sulfur cluster repair protein YtfE (RIC family)
MGSVQEAIAAHHRELTAKLAEQVTRFETSDASGDDLVAFLKTELLPHAAGEEQHLYPVMDDLIRQFGAATKTMQLDHEYIVATSRQIEEQARALSDAKTDEERARQRTRLAKVAAQLEAVLRLHVDKEERAYLPLFEQHLPADEQQRILEEMHETADEQHAGHASGSQPDIELDVRPLPPAQRHAVIFRTFDALPGGEAFVLINDHDPKPLYYQLNAERAGQLVWEYLEEGPSEWRVSIGKTL